MTSFFTRSIIRTILGVFLIGSVLTLSAQPDKKRWKKLDEYVLSSLETWDVPGVAIGIIDHGEVILLKGYGLRDVENNLPVTPQTTFAIGSSSKAFTALAVSILVEDGLIEWDEPLKTYLPDFEMWDETATNEMTAVDMLSHVSGLPRHDLAWYGSTRSREDLYLGLKHFEPTTSFRGGWQYQNLMFMTAGVLIERMSGLTWEEFIQERIMDPLGMDATSPEFSALADNELAAKGYGLEEEELELLPYRDLSTIGPAGSINSTAEDMLKWMNMLLYRGMVDTQQVVEGRTVGAVMRPRAVMPGGASEDKFYSLYGMGWMITSYRGNVMIEHGGNIDGFSAGVCLLPQDSIGIVVLTNMNGTPIPTIMEFYLTDLLLDLEETDWSEDMRGDYEKMMEAMSNSSEEEDLMKISDTHPSKELSAYAGTYHHPGYGDLLIIQNDSGLTMRYNTLESALEHYHYDVFRANGGELNTMKAQFFLSEEGELSECAIGMQQGVEKIRFEKQPETMEMEEGGLDEFVGEYELMGMTITIKLEEEGLTMTVPGQPVYSLAPIREDVFDLVDMDGFSVIFGRDDDGNIITMTSAQPNGNFKAERKME